MGYPAFRITLKTLISAVAIAAWFMYQCRIIAGFMEFMFGIGPPAAGEAGRILVFSMLAPMIGSVTGSSVAALCWLGLREVRPSSIRGLVAGGQAGFCAWCVLDHAKGLN